MCVFASASPLLAFEAGPAPGLAIVYFETDRAVSQVSELPFARRQNAEFNVWVEGINTEIMEKQRELNQMAREIKVLQELGQAADAERMAKELIPRAEAFEVYLKEKGELIGSRRLKTAEALEDQFTVLIHELAVLRGWGLVLEKKDGLVYRNVDHDITDDVAALYAERFTSFEDSDLWTQKLSPEVPEPEPAQTQEGDASAARPVPALVLAEDILGPPPGHVTWDEVEAKPESIEASSEVREKETPKKEKKKKDRKKRGKKEKKKSRKEETLPDKPEPESATDYIPPPPPTLSEEMLDAPVEEELMPEEAAAEPAEEEAWTEVVAAEPAEEEAWTEVVAEEVAFVAVPEETVVEAIVPEEAKVAVEEEAVSEREEKDVPAEAEIQAAAAPVSDEPLPGTEISDVASRPEPQEAVAVEALPEPAVLKPEVPIEESAAEAPDIDSESKPVQEKPEVEPAPVEAGEIADETAPVSKKEAEPVIEAQDVVPSPAPVESTEPDNKEPGFETEPAIQESVQAPEEIAVEMPAAETVPEIAKEVSEAPSDSSKMVEAVEKALASLEADLAPEKPDVATQKDVEGISAKAEEEKKPIVETIPEPLLVVVEKPKAPEPVPEVLTEKTEAPEAPQPPVEAAEKSEAVSEKPASPLAPEQKSAPAVSEALAVLGHRYTGAEDYEKAWRIFRDMVRRAPGEVWAVKAATACSEEELKFRLKHLGEKAFFLKNTEGCFVIYTGAYSTKALAEVSVKGKTAVRLR